MDKGINTLIIETKKEIIGVVNQAISKGLPYAVVDLMIENITLEIKELLSKSLTAEQQKANEEQALKDAQVPYVEPNDND